MKNVNMWLAALGLACALPAVAHAGPKNSMPVYIDKTNSYAQGSPASAYSSPDNAQRLQCWLNAMSTQAVASGGCYAIDATGQMATCRFYDKPALAQVVSMFSSDTYVAFTWDTSGSCTNIIVSLDSSLNPKR